MRRFAFLFLAATVVFSCVGCAATANDIIPKDGEYLLVGDYEAHLTPYLHLNMEEKTFMMGAGMVYSYAEFGTFEIRDHQLIATSQTTTFVFEIKDENTLILVDNGGNEYFKLPKDAEFVHSEN